MFTLQLFLYKPVNWRLTNWHILVKSFSFVYNATFPAHKLTTKRDTWRPTLERKHTSVLSVTILSFIVRSWKITCGPIQEMCDQCAHSCAQSQDLKVHKRKHTREKPFNCDQCDHTCALAGTLKVHTRETLRIWAVWLFLCSCFSSEAT